MGMTVIGGAAIVLAGGALLLAALPLRRPLRPLAVLFGAGVPLSAAAAFVLPFGGGASILVSALLAIAFCVAVAPRLVRVLLAGGAGALRPSAPTMFIILFAVLAIAGAFLLPAVFAGQVQVFALDRTASGVTDAALKLPLVPLGPSASAITQSLWLASTVAVFIAMTAAARADPGIIAYTIWGATGAHLALAALDALGWPGMALFRTAAYQIAPDQVLAGFTRLTGAASEPSQFGATSAVLASSHLWRLRGGSRAWHGLAAMLLIVGAVASLSSTALATLAIVLGIFAISLFMHRRSLAPLAALCLAGTLAVPIAGWLLLGPFSDWIAAAGEAAFWGKLTSESGVERAAWAAQALRNLVDTQGLGTGLGAAKASGWATALLGQTGLPGTVLMAAFLWSLLRRRGADRAARAMLLTAIFAALLSEGRVDPGYLFAIAAAGVAASAKAPIRRRLTEVPRHAAAAV